MFIDEVDKLCANKTSLYRGASPSDEGVQKDLLPLIEGCAVKTKWAHAAARHSRNAPQLIAHCAPGLAM